MPVVHIDMWEGRDKETKKKLIESVADAIASTLNIPDERIEIIINELPKENWGKGRKQASEI